MDRVQRVLGRCGPGSETLTSRQQFAVLDQLLENALRPLESETEAFLAWVAEMLAHTVKSRRRNAREMQLACAAVLSGAPTPIARLVRAGLDRSHAFAFLERACAIGMRLVDAERRLAAGDEDRHELLRVMHDARHALGGSDRLAPAIVESAFWLQRAAEWRNGIIDHYMKFLYKSASGMNRASGGRIETEPTFHDAWLSAASSANRFRSDQATFAGFLGRSLMGAYRIASSHALGLAAPGARVQSEDALQTTELDAALDLADDPVVHQDRPLAMLRAMQVARVHPDVRVALMVSQASPVEALAALGRGPLATPGGTAAES